MDREAETWELAVQELRDLLAQRLEARLELDDEVTAIARGDAVIGVAFWIVVLPERIVVV